MVRSSRDRDASDVGPLRARDLSGSGTASMVVGTLASASGAYVYQLLGARTLGPEGFAPVAVLWTIRFLLVTIVFLPVEQLAIRRVIVRGSLQGTARRMFVASIALGVVLGVTTGIWHRQLFGGGMAFALMAACLAPAFAVFGLARGRVAGYRMFGSYGLATGTEAIVQLLFAGGAAVAFSGRPDVYALAMVVSPFVLIPWLRKPEPAPSGATLQVRQEQDQGVGARRFLGEYVVGNAAAQTVLAGGPIAVASLGASAAAVSIATLTMTLFRAPLTLSYNLVARILPALVRQAASEGAQRIQTWARRTFAGGILLAVAATALGPILGSPAVGLLFGEDFRPSPLFAAVVAGGMALALASLAVQQGLVALDQTRSIASSWLVGLSISASVLLLTNGAILPRVAMAFASGELVALTLLVRAVLGVREDISPGDLRAT